MYIDKNKILQSKIPKVSEVETEFNILKENDTPVNRLHFMEFFRLQPNNVIKEHLNYLYGIPSVGTDFLNQFIKTSRMQSEDIEIQKENLASFIDKLNKNNYVNTSHLNELKESISLMESLIEERKSTQYLKDDTIVQLNVKNIRRQCAIESYLADDIDVIINNINYNPESIVQYEKIVREIKTCKSPSIVSSFPMILVKNTELILGISISSIGTQSAQIISQMPIAIAEKIVEFKASKSQIISYNKILDKQIAGIYTGLKTGENSKYNLYMMYLESLKKSKDILNKKIDTIKESSEITKENIAEMQPEIKMYEDGVVEDLIAELEDELVNMIFDDNEEIPEETIENLTRIHKAFESLSIVEEENKKIINNKGEEVPKICPECKSDVKIYIEGEPIFKCSNKDCNKYFGTVPFNAKENYIELLDEADIGKKIVQTAHNVERASQKVVGKIAHGQSVVKRVATPINKITDPFVTYLNKTIDDIKELDAKERRNRIITGQFRFKLFNAISKAVATIASGAAIKAGLTGGAIVAPVLTLIATITAIAIDKNLDKKQRQKILQELESELKIVNEKIEDSRGDEDKQKKYELMRIQQKLEKDIERIKFRLDE